MSRIKIILNNHGGLRPGQAKRTRLERTLQETKVDYSLETIDEPGQGIELARRAALDGYEIVAAAGGDGTIHEVVNGLIRAAGEEQAGKLGILPLGTANDLAEAMELPLDLKTACLRLTKGESRLIDVGRVNDRYFANNSAVGMEAVVTMTHDRMRWIKGKPRYVVAALRSVIRGQTWSMSLKWANNSYTGPVTLVSVGNSPRTGGSFIMNPKAVLDDGYLNFMCASGMPRWRMLWLLPKVIRGSHLRHPKVIHQRITEFSIISDPPTPIQADGEIIDTAATEIHYRIIPAKLHIIV